MATYPKFSQPPWQNLDPRKHVELIYKLIMSRGKTDQYFRRGLGVHLPPIPDTGDRIRVTNFIVGGGQLRVWRTRLFDYYGVMSDPAPPGEQTIIELGQSFKNDPKAPPACRDNPQLLSGGSVYIVTADLKGPDPHVPDTIAYALQEGELLMYEGVPYLVTGYGLVERMQTSAHLPDSFPPFHYCGYRFNQGDK